MTTSLSFYYRMPRKPWIINRLVVWGFFFATQDISRTDYITHKNAYIMYCGWIYMCDPLSRYIWRCHMSLHINNVANALSSIRYWKKFSYISCIYKISEKCLTCPAWIHIAYSQQEYDVTSNIFHYLGCCLWLLLWSIQHSGDPRKHAGYCPW